MWTMIRSLPTLARKGLAALLPAQCLLCHGAGPGPSFLCPDCLGGLPRNDTCCRQCAIPLPVVGVCGECLRHPPKFDAAHVPLRYDWPTSDLVTRLKFRNDLSMLALVRMLFAEAVPPLPSPSVIVPVPLSRQRLLERGYNQAQLLAETLVGNGHGHLVHALTRVRDGGPQVGRSRKDRRRNVRGAFVADATVVRGRTVCLVDDVLTTTATVRACADVLRAAGASRVVVVALARAAGGGPP